uniref:Ankycorbin n=3 Tax=Cacopsylla melanoneura TaxID=428564 RepID=A0A8D8X0S9_9HEMI
MFACYHGREDVVANLVQMNADLLIADSQGQTALLIAASSNNLAILSSVYDERIVNCEDTNGWTPLFHAVNVGFEPGIHYLLQHKADINHKDKSGWTVLMLACSNGAQNIIQILFKYNPDKEMLNQNEESAEDIIIKYSRRSSLVTLLQLQTPHSDALAKLLHELSLDKYYPVLRTQQIGLNEFSRMNEQDLKDAGITLLGPRRKMYLAICKLKGEEYKKD